MCEATGAILSVFQRVDIFMKNFIDVKLMLEKSKKNSKVQLYVIKGFKQFFCNLLKCNLIKVLLKFAL